MTFSYAGMCWGGGKIYCHEQLATPTPAVKCRRLCENENAEFYLNSIYN